MSTQIQNLEAIYGPPPGVSTAAPTKVVTDQHPRFIFSAGQPLFPDKRKHGIAHIPRAIIFKVDRLQMREMRGPEDSEWQGPGDDGLKAEWREPRNVAYDLVENASRGVVNLEALVGESNYDVAAILATVFDGLLPTTPSDRVLNTYRELGEYLDTCGARIPKLEPRLRPIAQDCYGRLQTARENAKRYQEWWLGLREAERAEALRPNGNKGLTIYGPDEDMFYAWLERSKPEIRAAELQAGAQSSMMAQIISGFKEAFGNKDQSELLALLLQENTEMKKRLEALEEKEKPAAEVKPKKA